MKREHHKKDKNRMYEKKKDKASIRKESISKKQRLKNNVQNFIDNGSTEYYNKQDYEDTSGH